MGLRSCAFFEKRRKPKCKPGHEKLGVTNSTWKTGVTSLTGTDGAVRTRQGGSFSQGFIRTETEKNSNKKLKKFGKKIKNSRKRKRNFEKQNTKRVDVKQKNIARAEQKSAQQKKKTRSERKTNGKKERTTQTTDENTTKNHLNPAKPAGSSADKQKFRGNEQNRPKTIKIEENPCKNACCRRVGKSLQNLHFLDVFDDILGGFWGHFLDDLFFDFFSFFFKNF